MHRRNVRDAREIQKRSSGEVGSQHARPMNRRKEEYTWIPASKAAKMIECAGTDLSSLTEVVKSVQLFPPQLRMDAINVFFDHIQTPVEQQICEKDDPYDWIMVSLHGIEKVVGRLFLEDDEALQQRFFECWPHVFKWLKALLDVRVVYDHTNRFSSVIGKMFQVCGHVNSSVLEDQEVLELAVRAWIGAEAPNGEDHYTGRPLLSCLEILDLKGDLDDAAQRVERALLACAIDTEKLVNNLIARLTNESVAVSSMEISKALTLSRIMLYLITFDHNPFFYATLEPSVGRCFTSFLKAVVDAAEQSPEHERAIFSSLAVLSRSLSYQAVDYAMDLVEAGILLPLLKLANLASIRAEPKDSDPTSLTLIVNLLHQLQLYLIYDTIILSCQDAFCLLYNGDLDVENMLKTSPKQFQEAWTATETLLLDHAVLFYLFERSYAPVDGICANYACWRVGIRKEFKKCAGCKLALYCSRSCQKSDWGSHRNGCKKMEEESINITEDYFSRFPRKIATLQVNRFWEQIVSLAEEQCIPLTYAAVRISCFKVPFKLEVFDYHQFLNDAEERPHLALVANEIQRQSEEGRRDWIIVTLCVPEMMAEYPYIVHLDDTWIRSVSKNVASKCNKKGDEEREPVIFVDPKGNALQVGKLDALRAGARLAKRYANEEGESVWSNDVLNRATRDVLESFE